MDSELELVAKALVGDGHSFDLLVAPHRGELHSFAYRLVAHPEDAEDLLQDSLIVAHQKLSSFRGSGNLRSWLFSIVSNKCLDYLRRSKRWPTTAQVTGAHLASTSAEQMQGIVDAASGPGTRYEVREHVAYCFSCVGRSLEPLAALAVVLRDIFDFGNREAAKMLGLSESVFRHHLYAARSQLTSYFEGQCALISKQGACWQCETLRVALPKNARGPKAESICDDGDPDHYEKRLRVIQESNYGNGSSKAVHDHLLRYMGSLFD